MACATALLELRTHSPESCHGSLPSTAFARELSACHADLLCVQLPTSRSTTARLTAPSLPATKVSCHARHVRHLLISRALEMRHAMPHFPCTPTPTDLSCMQLATSRFTTPGSIAPRLSATKVSCCARQVLQVSSGSIIMGHTMAYCHAQLSIMGQAHSMLTSGLCSFPPPDSPPPSSPPPDFPPPRWAAVHGATAL